MAVVGKLGTEVAWRYGQRILQLLGEADMDQTELCRLAKVKARTLTRDLTLDRPPRGAKVRARIERMESVLGGAIWPPPAERQDGVLDRLNINQQERKVVVQPYDFKKKALIQIGLSRHELSVLLDALEEGDLDIKTLAAHLEKADEYAAKAQRHLMGKIEINDKGEKV